MNKPLHVTIPITKIDEDQRMVYGYATVEEIDAHGEIIGYEASKKAFSNWIGNIRDMHQDIAVGKNMETEFDDDSKGVWIGAKISESDDGEQAWIKVKEGVYSGFSIGGKVNDAEVRQMSVDGKKKGVTVITDYDLGEVSLVDNPACPSAIFQMVKSVDGKLNAVEETHQGIGRPVHWWEKQFKFSDSQSIMKADFMTYNKNSMSNKQTTLTKSLWEASMLVDLAMCLSEYIYWKAWEGEDMTELKGALATIQSAAAKEITEPENFPEVEVAIENATRALNISKKEELVTMSKDIADRKNTAANKESIEKAGSAVVDSDPRDENGATIAEVTAGPTAVKPGPAAVPKKVYARNGVTTTQKSADGAEGEEEAEEVVPAADDVTDTDATVDDTAVVDAEDTEDGAVDADAAADTTEEGEEDDESKKSAPAPMKKSTGENDDLAKSILSGVEKLIEKSIAPLKEEIETLKKQPAASKVKSTFTVKKGEEVDGNSSEDNSNEGKLKAEFDTLNKRADELAADPNVGTPDERMQVGFKLRKLSRQLDPASVAQHAAVRATFNRGV